MKTKRMIGVAALIGVLAVSAVAGAVGTLGVSARGAKVVTYPHPAQFTVRWSEPASQPIDVQVRYAGGEWRTFRTISATRAVESTKPATVVLPKPSADFEIRAVQGALESAIATGGVRSTLMASSRGSYRRGERVVVKGSIMPTLSVDSTITVKVWKTSIKRSWHRGNGFGRPVLVRELVGEFTGKVYKSGSQMSLWKASFAIPAKGDYEARAYYDDATHSPGASRLVRFRVK
ncbi:MAG: hypothetical protein U1E26_08775 [Coriobacteriia bacterium]|nr:hypothetical protein [Coriobacteriia bacterium]